MTDDWLALPAPAEPEKNPDLEFLPGRSIVVREQEKAAARAEIDEVVANLPARIAPRPVALAPSDPGERLKQLDRSWQVLTEQQRAFLTMLRQNNFNVRATCRVMELTAYRVSRTSVTRWRSDDSDFRFVMDTMQATDAGDAISRDRLLLRAEEIAETALEPKPILYQGAPTGYSENHPDTALRANEQLMKAAGMLKGEDKSARVVVRVVNLAGPEQPAPAPAIEVAAEVIE